ncbi:MAG: AraC family transcriptional regulator [Deltaproteobacteria bacterium]|nr:MAG: AraC family transcriptional regulator [Deltaproteobacteria bacterium]
MATHGFALEPHFKALIVAVGAQPEDVLRRAGLPEDLLNRDNVRLSSVDFIAFGEAILEAVGGDPRIAIELGKASVAQPFTPWLFAVLCSPNLHVGLQRLSHFKALCAPVALDLAVVDDELHVHYRWLDTAVHAPAWMVAVELVILVELARAGTRQLIVPTHAELPPLEGAEWAEYLGTALSEGADLKVRFAMQDAERPFLTANASMWQVFEPELRRRLADLEGSATVAQRARAVLLEALPSGQLQVDIVARRLGMSGRSLQRKLRAEGSSYSGLVRDTREELARHYLSRTELSSSEIAFLLGFEETSSFFRAFHTWTGRTPEAARRAWAS